MKRFETYDEMKKKRMEGIEELKCTIEKKYGFKKELIHDVQSFGSGIVHFSVNDIKYHGSLGSISKIPQLSVEGYVTSYYYQGIPFTKEEYEEQVAGKCIWLYRMNKTVEGDIGRERMQQTFTNPKEAETYIEGLDNPDSYFYDVDDFLEFKV